MGHRKMVVIGAGLAGVSSAYLLCKSGYDVTLVDQFTTSAQGSSQQNGAQLSYAYCDALASPSLLNQLPSIMLKKDPAFRCSVQLDPDFMIWGIRFLLNSRANVFVNNTTELSKIALRTASLLEELNQQHSIGFDYVINGKMLLYPTMSACIKNKSMLDKKAELGFDLSVLTREEASLLEPALQRYPDDIGAVVYSPNDAVGRPDQFCQQLINILKNEFGMRTMFNQKVHSIEIKNGRVCSVRFRDNPPIRCDAVVVATGLSCDLLPLKDRIYGDMWPVQGYSITQALQSNMLTKSITDVKRKLVFAPVGDSLRVAGLADIGKKRFSFNQERCHTLLNTAVEAFPDLVSKNIEDQQSCWSGARYVTPSSKPVIRASSVKGLYLNLGHGTLGWTLSLGAAERLLHIVNT